MDKEEIKRRLRAKAASDPKLQKAIAHSERVKVEVPVKHSEPVKSMKPIKESKPKTPKAPKAPKNHKRSSGNLFFDGIYCSCGSDDDWTCRLHD